MSAHFDAGGFEAPCAPDTAALRSRLRQDGIRAREAIPEAEREALSAAAAENIAVSSVFRRAHTVLIYAHTGAELSLEALTAHPLAAGKVFAYPLCTGDAEMAALVPDGADAWQAGYCGISEPRPERSRLIPPEEIGLVVCPCTAFDAHGVRLGMGAGFYDRFLPKCTNAAVIAAAFETQRADGIPRMPWDRTMDAVFTEQSVYPGSAAE